MAEQAASSAHPTLDIGPDEPLTGVFAVVDGAPVVRCFGEDGAPADREEQAAQAALVLAGAWEDLDWDEMIDALDA